MPDALLDRPDVRAVLFHPRSDTGRPGPGRHAVTVEVEPGVSIGGILFPAQPAAPVLLYYHGNGEIAADYADIASLYTQLGITMLVLDYRGYGSSSGAPTAASLLTDAVATFRAVGPLLTEHGLEPTRIYVMGRSLGSVPAIELALQMGEHLAGLIVESGFADTFALLARMGVWLPDADEQQDGFANGFKMARVTTPTLILHGQNDLLIPPEDGKQLYEHCAATDKHLVLIPHAGHNDIMLIGMKPYFQAIHQFIQQGAQTPH